MSGKEVITNKIISSASESAEAMLSDTRVKCEAERKALLEDLAAQEQQLKSKLLTEADEIEKRRLTLAELDGRKAALGVKQKLIGETYDAITEKLLSDDKKYFTFIEKLIVDYAEDGDEVVLSKSDKDRFDKAWIAKISAKINKKLVLSTSNHDDKGGIVLSGKNSDKNLTLTSVLKNYRAETESRVAEILFSQPTKK